MARITTRIAVKTRVRMAIKRPTHLTPRALILAGQSLLRRNRAAPSSLVRTQLALTLRGGANAQWPMRAVR
jgi:hypothetical protein